MSEADNRILEANRKLLDDKIMLLDDINILIRFIKGERELKEEVKLIIKYYKKVQKYCSPRVVKK